LRNSHQFNASDLGKLSVIRIYYEYPGEPPGEKLFVVLNPTYRPADQPLIAFCLKVTSNVARYESDPQLLKGCVLVPEKALPFFPVKSVIQPDNLMPLSHEKLLSLGNSGQFRLEGQLPVEYETKLIAAIDACKTLNPKKKKIIKDILNSK
jgi:hypothetical protein